MSVGDKIRGGYAYPGGGTVTSIREGWVWVRWHRPDGPSPEMPYRRTVTP